MAHGYLLPLSPHLCAEHARQQRTLSINRIDRHVLARSDSAFLITALTYQGYLSPLVLRRGVHSVEVWLRRCLKTGDRVEKRRAGEKGSVGGKASISQSSAPRLLQSLTKGFR